MFDKVESAARNWLVFVSAGIVFALIDRTIEPYITQDIRDATFAIVLASAFGAVLIAVGGLRSKKVSAGFREVEERCGTAAAEAVMRGLDDAKAGRIRLADLPEEPTSSVELPPDLLTKYSAWEKRFENIYAWTRLIFHENGQGEIELARWSSSGCDCREDPSIYFDSVAELEALIQ